MVEIAPMNLWKLLSNVGDRNKRRQILTILTVPSWQFHFFPDRSCLQIQNISLQISEVCQAIEIDVKRGCVTAVQFILFNFANYSPSIAMELKVSKEIACKWPNQRSETKKYVSWALFFEVASSRDQLWKTVIGWTVFQNPNNLYQFCPSVASIVSVMLF